MTSIKTNFSIILTSILLFQIFSCQPAKEDKIKKKIKPTKFYNARNPGKWKNNSYEHIPQVTVKTDKINKIINVTVPLEGRMSPIHYIEVIVLLDHNRKELQKKTFPSGNKKAEAVFKLPKNYSSFVYVVAKCNLHDMWEKRVSW
ncbi:desulfoferrodoxin family protein [Spirochaetota bacterium]